MTEIIKPYQDWEVKEQRLIVAVLCDLFKLRKKDVVNRICNVSNPKFVVVYQDDDKPTAIRIHDENSRKVFALVLSQYLNEAK